MIMSEIDPDGAYWVMWYPNILALINRCVDNDTRICMQILVQCTQKCGGGYTSRSRKCSVGDCRGMGSSFQTANCNTQNCGKLNKLSSPEHTRNISSKSF